MLKQIHKQFIISFFAVANMVLPTLTLAQDVQKNTKSSARILQLDETNVSSGVELPNMLYLFPWKTAGNNVDLSKLKTDRAAYIKETLLTPVDREGNIRFIQLINLGK